MNAHDLTIIVNDVFWWALGLGSAWLLKKRHKEDREDDDA